MAIFLQELTTPLRYMTTDDHTMVYDFFAMADLWRKVGSQAHEPVPQAKQKIIDILFDKVAETLASKIVKDGTNLPFANPVDKREMDLLLDKMEHDLKMHDVAELQADIQDYFTTAREKNLGNFGQLSINPTDIKTIQRISHPARFIDRVSPIVAATIRANLQYFGPAEKIHGELNKEKLVTHAPRGEFTPSEKQRLIDAGFTIEGLGFATSTPTINATDRYHIDKLKDNSFLFYTTDRTTIELFATFEEVDEYIAIELKGKMLGRKGFDRTAFQPELKPEPAAKPTDYILPTAAVPIRAFTPEESKRLSPNFERIMMRYGYHWDEGKRDYLKVFATARENKIVVHLDNSATLYTSTDTVEEFKNLGLLFKTLEQRKKTEEPRLGQPKAQVNKENYKDLYSFLYDT